MNSLLQTQQPGRTERHILYTLIVVCLLTLATFLTGVPTLAQDMTCDPTTDYLAEGEAQIVAGDYTAAGWAYDCAIDLDSGNYVAYFWRGALASAGGDYNQLGDDLNTFMQHRTGGSDPLRLAIVKALPSLTEAVGERPDDPTAYLLHGLSMTMADLRADADFEKVMELAPENATGYLFYWLSSNPINGADFDAESYAKGIELAGDSTLVDWIHSFAAVDMTESIAEANLIHFDEVIANHPDHPFAFAARGMAHVMLGDESDLATNDFYQHIQNNKSTVFYEDELPLGTNLAFDATPGALYNIPFTAEAGQLINVAATRTDGGIFYVFPITHIILDPAGNVMPLPYSMLVFMGGTRTPVVGLEIPESGTYTLLVTPNYDGEVDIAVWATE